MWRSFFLAVGIFLLIVGMECLGVESVKLKMRDEPAPANSPWETAPTVGPNTVLLPPPWAPWSLMGTGAVVCLYSFTIPKRLNGG